MMDDLSADRVCSGLGTGIIGRACIYHAEIDSTNEEARRLADQGACEGTLVICDFQTAGRGRLGRRWEAPRGSSLLFSLIFRPDLAASEAAQLTMVCGLAVLDAMRETSGLDVGLKWPNDIVRGDAKLGGVLTELEVSAQDIVYAVVGIGLNVNLDPSELPGNLMLPATSISHELGRRVERLLLLQALLQSIEVRYLALRSGRSPHQDWAAQLATLGKPVRLAGVGNADVVGMAEDVGADGALLVRLADGTLVRVISGDVLPGTRVVAGC
jgi:BirA family biotin operon repressor/biotin-[acetyl-CoA-carboxylase] ligase